ncbi:MAG: hypothetical protein AB1330_11110 [Bacillota bacterium]
MADWKERLDEFDRDSTASREISRTAIYRIIILSASIVGFSVSLFSISSLQSSLEVGTIRYSWYCFLGAIMIGFFILMLEGRVKYAKTWKGFQASDFPKT